MLFDDEFIGSLRNNPLRGTILLCKKAIDNVHHENGEWGDGSLQVLLEAYAFLVEITDAKLVPSLQLQYPKVIGTESIACMKLFGYIRDVLSVCEEAEASLFIETLRSRFKLSLGTSFAYEFSQGDLMRVQVLLNELRDQIANATQLDKEHQQRLLHRLEKLQAEIHKKVSDLDRFWGLVGDAGVVLGKLGRDAKPIVDRIHEIAAIVWRTQSRAEELPSDAKIPTLENNAGDEPNED